MKFSDVMNRAVEEPEEEEDDRSEIDDAIDADNDIGEALSLLSEFQDAAEGILKKDAKEKFLHKNSRVDLIHLLAESKKFTDQWEWE